MSKIWVQLSDKDLDFLIETVHPEVIDKLRLRQIIREDEEFRNTFIADEKVFRRLMGDEEIFLKISPTLFFEILLTFSFRPKSLGGHPQNTRPLDLSLF